MAGQILGDRYQVEKQLGKQSGRWTLLAQDLTNSGLVILKLLFIDNDLRPDDLKLFNREVEILQTIHHPAMPQYLGYFEIELPRDGKALALVQTYIEGTSIDKYLRKGRIFSEKEARQVAKSVLKLLIYLHNHQPPIIHRDIKPSNILLSNPLGQKHTRVCLVDFGSVKSVGPVSTATYTIVGTDGYMPPEQMGGRAVKASDLYCLGATLATLVIGREPSELPHRQGKIDFSKLNAFSPAFADWLARMTEPDLHARFRSTEEALDALQLIPNSSTATS